MSLRRKFSQNKQLTTKFDELVQIANILCSHYKSLPVDFGIDLAFFFLSDPFTKQIMKEYHNTDPTFDEYKYAYGEPDQSKVKTILIMKCRKGLFLPSIFARKRYLRRLFKNILYL